MKIKSLIYPALLTGLLLAFLFSCKKETPKVAPTPSVAEVATVTGTTATIKIGIVSDGGATITERGVCWNTSPNPTINNHIRSATLSNGTISLTISDLLPNKTYYFRAYAVNPAGVGYSEQSTITTLTLAPALTTLDLTAVTSTTASGGGNITSDGGVGVTARGICWSLNQNPTIADSRTVDGSGTGSFTSTITGLTPGARYHFRAYATNSEGTNYGNEVTATIPGVLPVLTTKAMAGVYTYSASTGGVISNNGGVPLTACGVAWSTNPSPTINDNISVFKTPVANFIIKISGLNAGTTYYIRAYATNSIGTAYGDQLSFKTNDAVNPAEDYLPLQVGNYWEFSDGHYISSLQIDQIEAFNGTDYYRIIRKENPVPPRQDTIYYRKTADGKIYQRTRSTNEVVTFYLAGSVGETWPCMQYADPSWFANLSSRTDTVRRNSVSFNNCFRFEYYFMAKGGDAGEWDYWLAPGLGFVKFWPISPLLYSQRRLTKARINGVESVY